MPLFFCPICGWTTTASLTQAARAHQLGVPDCDGILEPVAYAGKRLTDSTDVGESDPGQAPSAVAATDTTSP
jgi:hypothetical protein